MTDKQLTLVTIYQVEVHKEHDKIDRGGMSGCEDWYSLSVGWALGKGLTSEEAHEFAYYIRYNTEMG